MRPPLARSRVMPMMSLSRSPPAPPTAPATPAPRAKTFCAAAGRVGRRYSDILYVKECKAELSFLAHRAVRNDKYRSVWLSRRNCCSSRRTLMSVLSRAPQAARENAARFIGGEGPWSEQAQP